jgi:hypothetical protein
MNNKKNVNHCSTRLTILPLIILLLTISGMASAADRQEESGIYGFVNVQARNSDSQDVVAEAEITALDNSGNVIARTLSNSKG